MFKVIARWTFPIFTLDSFSPKRNNENNRVTHICVSILTIISSDNGLSPERRQAIIWTIVIILLIGTLGTSFSEILNEIHIFSFKEMHLKTSSAKWRPFCLGLNILSPISAGPPNCDTDMKFPDQPFMYDGIRTFVIISMISVNYHPYNLLLLLCLYLDGIQPNPSLGGICSRSWKHLVL